MAWFDDRIWCHPKLVNLSDKSHRIWVNSVAYSSGFNTGGELSAGQQKLLGTTPKIRRELIAAGAWDELDGKTVSVHNWQEHNGKRDAARLADRDRKRTERAKKYGAEEPLATCSGCLDLVAPGNKFCPGCGTQVADSPTDSPPDAPLDSPRDGPSDTPLDKPLDKTSDRRTLKGEGCLVSSSSNELSETPQPVKRRARDELWDVFAEVCGEPVTESERGRRNKALRELRAIGADATMVRQRVIAYRQRWPDVELTATGIAANWTTLGPHLIDKRDASERVKELMAKRGHE